MVRKAAGTEDGPAVQDVLEALADPACQSILRNTDEPMTATELSTACDIPPSTLYRKLELLSEASLLREFDEIGAEGGRITHYERDMTDVTVSITEADQLSITVARPARRPDERLADMWSKMGDEL